MPIEAGKVRQLVIENTIRGCQLFVGLPANDVSAIAAFIVPKHLGKGDYLFREGDRSEGFYVVQKGAINVHRVGAGGKEQVIHVFRPIESFAEATLATEGGYPGDARATEASTVLLVPKRDFIDLLRNRPELSLRMLGSMSQHLRVIVGLLDDLTLKDIETRLANWLLKQCPRPVGNGAVEIKLDRTKRVLAAEMGITSETLSRTLAKFRDQKLLRVSGKTIVITQPRKLDALLRKHLGEV
ncbi:MAG TPA: Crp/Fnr family transcriptional regulator [Chthoniobacterales bacterium]|nr:Crp/Fnr family transcriptional regulator [Chthoniobacterales bacterium]